MSPASDRWNQPLSADGRLAVLVPTSGAGFAIQVAPTAGGSARTYAQVPGCDQGGYWRPDAWFFQFVHRRSLVYGSWCEYPTADLYAVSSGGGQVHRITNLQTNHTTPALSPDGSEIAYAWAQCTGGGCNDHSYSGPVEPPYPPSGIRVLKADGSGERILTDPGDCTYDSMPTWSPNGSTILFSESRCAKAPELFTVPAAGGPVHDLGIVGSDPAWGPSRIAYVGDAKSDPGLWTASPDGSNRVKVAAAGSDPAWSSDGRLAYIKRPAKGTALVVGSTQKTLRFASVSALAWSPDGTRLVITARATPTGPSDVYTIKPDGTGLVRLTTSYDAVGVSW
jgi:Tol biopolymer transport system component